MSKKRQLAGHPRDGAGRELRHLAEWLRAATDPEHIASEFDRLAAKA